MASKNVGATSLHSYNGSWYDSSSEASVWMWERTWSGGGYKAGRVTVPSLNIGSATINSILLYLKTGTDFVYSGTSLRFRLAVSSSGSAHTTDITSSYITTGWITYYNNTVYGFDITSIIGNIANVNATFYVYLILDTGNDHHEIEFQRWSENYSEYQPYLAIDYTVTNSTIGLYNGSSFTNRIIKKRVSGAWVQCDCYKYNGTTWEKVSTT